MTTFLTLEEAAERIRVRPSTVRTYVRQGRLPGKRVIGSKRLLIAEADLLALLEDVRENVSLPRGGVKNSPKVPVRSPASGPRPTARELMRMSPEQRRPYLEASAAAAVPIYAADLARPEHERQLTADLETGDIYDTTDMEAPPHRPSDQSPGGGGENHA